MQWRAKNWPGNFWVLFCTNFRRFFVVFYRCNNCTQWYALLDTQEHSEELHAKKYVAFCQGILVCWCSVPVWASLVRSGLRYGTERGIIMKYFEASCWDIQNWKSCWAFILIPLSVIFESKHPFLVATRFLFTRLCVLCLRRSLFHHRAVIFLFQVLLRKAINIFQTLNMSFNPFVFNCRTEQKGIYRAQRILLQFHWKLSTSWLHNGSK